MIEIIIGAACGLISVIIWWAIWYFAVVPQKQKKMEEEIRKEAEVIKQKKLLEVKEENDFFCGGYGFKPFLFFVFLLYPFI